MDKWTKVKVADKPAGRVYHSCVVHNDDLYMFGGSIYVESQKTATNQLLSYHFTTQIPPSTLEADLRNLLKSGELTDVILTGKQGVSFKAHKPVLAARSGFFSLHFMSTATPSRKSKAPTTNIKVSLPMDLDEDSQVIEKLLEYIYTDQIDFSNATLDTLFRLASVAPLYEVERLGTMCQNHVCTSLSIQNVLKCLKWAVSERSKLVETFCYQFILKNYGPVLGLEEVSTLSPQLLVSIMRMQHQTDSSVPVLDDVPASSFVEDFTNLFKDMDFGDFTLITRSEEMPAHICMLGARSEYFRALFRSGMKEVEKCSMQVQLDELQPPRPVMESFLQFLYYDHTEMPVEHSVYLLPFSDFFGLSNSKLKSHCLKNIENHLEPSNVLQSLEAADAIKCVELKVIFLEEIVSNLPAVMQSKYVEKLSHGLLVEILKAVAASQSKQK